MKNNNGNTLIIVMIFFALFITILMLATAIFMGNVNGILQGFKTDMYLINKSAIVSVNKNKANVDEFSYDEKEYKKYFEKMLIKNFKLNENMENGRRTAKESNHR